MTVNNSIYLDIKLSPHYSNLTMVRGFRKSRHISHLLRVFIISICLLIAGNTITGAGLIACKTLKTQNQENGSPLGDEDCCCGKGSTGRDQTCRGLEEGCGCDSQDRAAVSLSGVLSPDGGVGSSMASRLSGVSSYSRNPLFDSTCPDETVRRDSIYLTTLSLLR